ncbi:MAG TPA: phospholipase D-like domain-containing protein [Symbiobacteriaceae bacterium]|nr:phospholipase D-like domain-containing protein [Symbiobacteriaceae bacterium]
MAALVAAAALLAGCAPLGGGGNRPTANTHLLIAEVYPNGRLGDGSDQFVRLYNPTGDEVALAGWSIGDGIVQAAFPQGARIGAKQSLYLALNQAGFQEVMGAQPQYVWRTALSGGESLRFGATNGTVVLRSPTGDEVDLVAYGAPPPAGAGAWKGAPVPSPVKGEIIDRARDEASWSAQQPGAYLPDTDTAADWKQGKAWIDGRVYRPGQTWFGYPTYRADSVTAYTSPDSAFAAVTDLIDGARQSLDLNMYDFTQVPIAERLAAAARRGVAVRIIMEAGSPNQLTDQERYMAKLVVEAGGQVRWIVNDPSVGVLGRYVYDHAKYAVVDGRTTLVQSENFVRHGTPSDPTFGNRGWGAVVADTALASYMQRVFEADWNQTYDDLMDYKPGTPYGPPPAAFVPETGALTGTYPHPFPRLTVRSVSVTPVLAPDHTLLDTMGIIGLMRGARESILIEQQYVHLHWGGASGSPQTTPDLYLEEAIAAARRGVKVRILLSDAFLDPKDPKDNTNTVDYVNDIARREKLDMQARIIKSDITALDKIHNKGVIVDGRKVLVSSVNWSLNSPLNNREVSLILDHPDLGMYFTDIFTYDWYNGAPADYPLITEIDATNGFVELTNPTAKTLDLSGWKLSAAAGTWALPVRTTIAAGKTLVIVRDAAAFQAKYGAVVTPVEIKQLALLSNGDTVQLQKGYTSVDLVAWGAAHPGWNLPKVPLCRPDPGKDTNTYLDWTPAARATPGTAGCGG